MSIHLKQVQILDLVKLLKKRYSTFGKNKAPSNLLFPTVATANVMSNSRDLIKAVSCLTAAYTEDLREIEELKKRLRRAERKIRDLNVEIQHYAEMAHNYESRMDRER